MSIKDNLPNDEIMRAMAAIAVEQTTAGFARQARSMAHVIPAGMSGRDALNAFADAIDSTNAALYPKPEGR